MEEWVRRWSLRVVVMVVTAFALTIGWVVYDGLNDSNGAASCAVVLGDSVGPDGKPSVGLRQRLDHVAGLLKSGGIRMVIMAVPSSAGDVKTIENGMSTYLASQGAPLGAVMQDRSGSTPETVAADVAAYTNPGAMTVLLVADYSQITRNKLALRDAGVATITTWHSGAFNANDLPSLAVTALTLWRTIFEKHIAPDAQNLVSEVQTTTHDLLSKTEQQGAESAKSSVKTEKATTNAAP